METRPLQARVLQHLSDTGMSVAELSRRSGVSYDVLNKLKHRDQVQSLENGARLQAYLDRTLNRDTDLTERQQMLLEALSGLTDDQLNNAVKYLRFLQSEASQNHEDPQGNA